MRKVPLYLLLFLYTAVQLKPLTAVVQDVLAHTFFSMQHMATVHYENGRYHLHKELKAISEQEQNSATQKSPVSEKTSDTPPPQNITEINLSLHTSSTGISFHSLPDPGLHKGFTPGSFRPPSQA